MIRDFWGHRRRKPQTAFVLGGGGNLGAAQVGMLRALVERGIIPDVLIGCSVGALNAAALAGQPSLDTVDRLEELWESLGGHDIFPGRLLGPWQLLRRSSSLYANDGLRAIIEKWIEFRTFEEAEVPLHVVTTCLSTGNETWFSSGEVLGPLLASAALPAIFPPVWIDGEPHIDGGVVNNVPVSRALELGARTIYLLHPKAPERSRSLPQRPLDVLVRAFSIARTHRHRFELERFPSDVRVVTLPCAQAGTLRFNDFSRTRQLISGSYAAAAAYLDESDRQSASGP